MFQFMVKRFLSMGTTLIGVVVLTFLLLHLVPGDPVEVLLGEQALPTDKEMLRESLGLNLPMHEQFMNFAWKLMHGDMGTSFYNNRDVASLIFSRLRPTVELALAAILFAFIFAFPLGIYAAIHKDKWQDKSALVFTVMAFSIPSFWLGPLLMILLSIQFDLLPVSGREGVLSVIMPAITLGFAMSGMTARLIRSSLLEAMGSDYIRTALAKGVSYHRVIYKHALRNALLPIVTLVFLQFAALLTGAILTETIFSWPGLGSLIVESLQSRDYAVVQGCVLFIAFVYMLMTFMSDVFYGLIDPRVRLGMHTSEEKG